MHLRSRIFRLEAYRVIFNRYLTLNPSKMLKVTHTWILKSIKIRRPFLLLIDSSAILRFRFKKAELQRNSR